MSVQPTRISGRHKGKRPRYAEPGASGSDADAMDMDDSDVEEATQKLPKLSQQGTPFQSKRRQRYTGYLHAQAMACIGYDRVMPSFSAVV